MKAKWGSRVVLAAASASLLCACKSEQVHAEEPVAQHHRPAWSAAIPMNVPAMAACLEERETPRYVVHVEALPSGATGVTTIDAYGALENCAHHDGKVVHRESMALSPEELIGLPVFSLGAQQPVVPVGVVLEEVLSDDLVVGWLYWPRAPADAVAGAGTPDVDAEH